MSIQRATSMRRRRWRDWKAEVKNIIRGHAPCDAARIVRTTAGESYAAGELSHSNHEKALQWADALYWKKTKFID